MTVRAATAGVGALALVGAAVAAAGARAGPDASASRHRYIDAGSRLHYQAVLAPLPQAQIGAAAAASLGRVRGARAGPLPRVLGAATPAIPPPGWPLVPLARVPGTGVGRAPLAARGRRECGCETEIGDARQERVAALYASRRFEIGDELGDLRLLELRATYGDGLVAHINGREVARRHLDRDVGPMGVAGRSRGPAWETFHIPVTPGLLERGENHLAVEVRPSGHSRAPRLDLTLRAAEGARIVRGPIVQRVGGDEAVIAFHTDLPAAGVVEFGSGPGLGRRARSAGGGLAVHHEVRLRDLPAAGAVHYRAVAGGDISDTFRFHTAPRPGEPIRFAVYGDVRNGHRVHRAIARAVAEEAPDFVVLTGDLVARGSDAGDWETYFAIAGELMARVPYYPAVGNHDVGRAGAEERRMNEIFSLWPGPADRPPWGHWYSFDVADVHVVMLDSNQYDEAAQLAWLERDLERARRRGVRAIFAATHDGPYSRGPHRGDRLAAERYAPLLRRYDVTLLFSGHDHLYQRGEVDGLRYLVTAGGGAPLYPIRCGVPGTRPCRVDDGVEHIARAHHYALVTVYRDHARMCPRRPDGTALEPCVRYDL